MDANRFDAFVRSLGLNAARRGLITVLLGGGLASLLATLESEARRHTGRRTQLDDDLSAAKKRKKKCKKCGPCKQCKKGKCKPKPNGTLCAGGSCQGGACRLGDEAPPCTEESCPLPPGCSQDILDDCTSALLEGWLADAEPCRPACQDPDSSDCQQCLEPILAARLPEAAACAVESCSSSERRSAGVRHRAQQQAAQPTPRAWWQRQCDKPTCCYQDLAECTEDTRDEALTCFGAALGAILTTGPAGLAAFVGCAVFVVFQDRKCDTRSGCLAGSCHEGDICCPYDATYTICNGDCCPTTKKCCGQECCDLRDECGENGECVLPVCIDPDHDVPCGDGCCEAGRQCCPSPDSNVWKCCRSDAICHVGSGDDPPACCLPGDKPCHGTCCSGSPQVLCCDKFNGQTYCYAAHAGCPA
jgi:hypothetical protein